MEVNLRSFLSEFNGSKFVLYSSFLSFTFLLALKLDGVIDVSYYLIFGPLFFGELIVFAGFIVGFIGFILSQPTRLDTASRNDFFSMCFCTLEHVLLFAFELLVSYKLENPDGELDGIRLSWVLVFAPLFVQSFMAMVIAIWCIRNDKFFEFEMFFAVNVIQFVFIAFKLDSAMHWHWIVVLVPVWVMFSLFYVGTLYSLIITIFLTRSLQLLSAHRRSHIFSTICHFFISIPLLMFFVLLVNKLDSMPNLSSHLQVLPQQATSSHHQSLGRTRAQLPHSMVACPLMLTFFLLLTMSFGSRSGNTWWFAMRKPFCSFIFEKFPCLQQYANISYKFGVEPSASVRRRNPHQPTRVDDSSGGERLQMLRSEQWERDITETSMIARSNNRQHLTKPLGGPIPTTSLAESPREQTGPMVLMHPD